MAFAQTNYDHIQGINGKYSIHDIGCFLTSFSNLELDYGKAISPLDINNILVQRNLFIDVDDGVRDDVDWNSVNYIDPDTRVARRGSSGWPNSNQAIVKFAYTSPRTQMRTTHFCKVADYANKMILDSWDGVVKHISSTWYGEPVEWAIYEHGIVAPPSPPQPKYSVIETYNPGKQIKLNKQPTYLWGMNYDFNYMVAHPVEKHDKGEVWTVTNKVHHEDGYDYYRRDGQVDGFNVADCDDYVAPSPTPYVPPSAPVTVPPAEKYTVVVPMDGFKTAADAKNQQNYYQPVAPGTYFVYGSKDLGMVNISLDNMKAGVWINPELNEVPQVPPATLPVDPPPTSIIEPVNDTSVTSTVPISNTAWKVTKSLRSDGQPVEYDATNSQPIRLFNLEYPNQSFIMEPYNNHKPVKIVSHFWKPDAQGNLIEYGRTPSMVKLGVFYDLKMSYLTEHHETVIQAAGDVIREDADTWGKFLENGFTTAERFISDIKPKLSHSAYKGKQFIDGFRKGQKK